MQKKFKLTKEQLIQLYINENKTVAQIAKELNIGTATVNRGLKQFEITKSNEQRAAAISRTKQNKTEDEKIEYAKHLSAGRKGKGLGQIPWNKNKHIDNHWLGKHHKEISKQKIIQTKQNKSEEEKRKIEAKRLASRVYGAPWNKGIHTGTWTEEKKQEVLAKQYITKKQNNSFKSSNPEDRYYAHLCEKFSIDDIIRQYSNDERYKFNCDFYIKSRDLFIELNLHWSHGRKLFSVECEDDLAKLAVWQEKAKISDFYKNAIETWTIRDPAKYLAAKENNLNYLVFYTEEEAFNYEY